MEALPQLDNVAHMQALNILWGPFGSQTWFYVAVMMTIMFIFSFIRIVQLKRQKEKWARKEAFLSRIAVLSSHGWIAFRKKTGVVECQTGISSFMGKDAGNLCSLDEMKGLWKKEEYSRWEQILAEIDNGGSVFKREVLTSISGRQLQVSYCLAVMDMQDIYVFILSDVTADMEHASNLQARNESLNKTIELLHKHMDALPFPVWQRDEHTSMVFCNKAYGEACGMSAEEVVRENRLLWMLDEGAESVPLLLQPLRKTMNLQGERKVYIFHEFQESENFSCFGFALDLSEMDALQSDFNRHISAYREVLDNISAGVTVYGPDRRIKYFNQAYARMFEVNQKWLATEPTLGEILDDLRARRLIPEQSDYASFKKKELQIITTILSPFQELQHLPDERSIRKIVAPHPMGGSFYIFEDVTASLTLERQYNTQLAVQRATLDNLYEGIAVFGSDNRLRLSNPAFERLWRLPPGMTEGKNLHISRLLDFARDQFDNLPSDWEKYKEHLISRLTDRMPKKRRLVRRDGTVMDFSCVPLPDGSNLISHVDVTDSCRVEKILRERNDALESATKIRTEFIMRVAEELANPLSVLAGTAEILSSEYFGEQGEQHTFLCARMLASSRQLLETIRDMHEITEVEKDAALPAGATGVDAGSLVRRLIQEKNLEVQQKNIVMTLECQVPLVMGGDEKSLERIFRLVMDYAIRSAGDQGKISLALYSEQSETTLQTILLTEIHPFSQGDGKNTGAFFDAIYSTRHLKFFLVQVLLEKHGGNLVVEPADPYGIRIRCSIPDAKVEMFLKGTGNHAA